MKRYGITIIIIIMTVKVYKCEDVNGTHSGGPLV